MGTSAVNNWFNQVPFSAMFTPCVDYMNNSFSIQLIWTTYISIMNILLCITIRHCIDSTLLLFVSDMACSFDPLLSTLPITCHWSDLWIFSISLFWWAILHMGSNRGATICRNLVNLGKNWVQCIAYQGTNKIQPVWHLPLSKVSPH